MKYEWLQVPWTHLGLGRGGCSYHTDSLWLQSLWLFTWYFSI